MMATPSAVESHGYEFGRPTQQVLWNGDRLFIVASEAAAKWAVGQLRARETELQDSDNDFDRGHFEAIVAAVWREADERFPVADHAL